MPKVEAIKTDKNGEFTIIFDAAKRNFYGANISELEVFRRYGNLPDNNILVNKLINVLGKNLLKLEKQAKNRARDVDFQDPSAVSHKNEIDFCSGLEQSSNAFYINLLALLAPLEQARLSEDKAAMSEKIKEILPKVKALYNARRATVFNEIQAKGGGDGSVFTTHETQDKEPIAESHPPIRRDSKVKESDEEVIPDITVGRLQKSKKNSEPIKNSRRQQVLKRIEGSQRSVIDSLEARNPNLQDIYRDVMDNFADEQRQISIFQHRAERPLDYANESLTEAYQNASYAMEEHVFSRELPTDSQLWMGQSGAAATKVDTRRFPSMRKEDALYTVALQQIPLDNNAASNEPSEQNADQFFATFNEHKTNISNISKENREASEKAAKNKSSALKVKAKEQVKPQEGKIQSPEELMKSLMKEPVPGDPTLLPGEKPVYLHHSSDIFSAIGFACVDFSKYFEREMAAKHPAMTAATFVSMVATFGAAGLSTAGVHAMQGLSNFMTKILTFNGKLGISPEKLHSAIEAISNEWLELTFSKGNLLHILIMDGFGLPKVNYVLFDSLFNGSENKDTISQLAERIASQDLTVYTDKEKKEKIIQNIFLTTGLLIGTVALGLGADMALKMRGITHFVAQMLTTMVEVPKEAITNVFGPQSLTDRLVAVLALTLTIKSSALFLGKAFLVLQHMKEPLNAKQLESFYLMAGLKELYDTDRMKEAVNSPDLAVYRSHFQEVLEKSPELESIFGEGFLNAVGIDTPPAPDLLDRVRTVVGTGIKRLFQLPFAIPLTFVGMGLGWRLTSDPLGIQAANDAFRSVVSTVLQKVLKPMIQLSIGIPLTIFGMGVDVPWGWNKDPASDPLGLKMAVKNFASFMGNMGIFGSAIVKTIVGSVYGLAQRGAMLVSDTVFDIIAFGNHFAQNPVNALLIAVGKLLLATASVVTTVVEFAVSAAAYLVTAATAVVGGVIGWVATVVAGLARELFPNQISKENVDAIWKAAKAFIKFPLAVKEAFSNSVVNPLKNEIGDKLQEMDTMLYAAKRGDSLLAARDKTTGGVARFFDGIKRGAGRVAYEVRTFFVRSVDEKIQDAAFSERSAAKKEEEAFHQKIAAQAAAATVAQSIPNENSALQGLGPHNVSSQPDAVPKSPVAAYTGSQNLVEADVANSEKAGKQPDAPPSKTVTPEESADQAKRPAAV